jgi:hypothetical protein
VLKRINGTLAALAGCAALDPLCARRPEAIATNGRMRRATLRWIFEVLDTVAAAIPTPALTRLAARIAVFTAVSLPSPPALAALPWSTSRESELFDSVTATAVVGKDAQQRPSARAQSRPTSGVSPYGKQVSKVSIHGIPGPPPSVMRSLVQAMPLRSTKRSNGSQKPRYAARVKPFAIARKDRRQISTVVGPGNARLHAPANKPRKA